MPLHISKFGPHSLNQIVQRGEDEEDDASILGIAMLVGVCDDAELGADIRRFRSCGCLVYQETPSHGRRYIQ